MTDGMKTHQLHKCEKGSGCFRWRQGHPEPTTACHGWQGALIEVQCPEFRRESSGRALCWSGRVRPGVCNSGHILKGPQRAGVCGAWPGGHLCKERAKALVRCAQDRRVGPDGCPRGRAVL